MAQIHFLNVNEGDCSIIQHENGNVSMIDICCGNIEIEDHTNCSSVDLKETILGNYHQKETPTNPISYLSNIGVSTIFRYIQTHPDMDHMDGLQKLKDSFEIINFLDTDNTKKQEFDEKGKNGLYLKKDWDCYQKLRQSKNAPKALLYYDGSRAKYFAKDENGELLDDYLQVLAPTKELIKTANDIGDWNDSSYVILYHIHGFKVLFCGDADMKTINHLLRDHKKDVANIDVLIAPHHGRDSDKDFAFLDVMCPQLTLFGNAKSKHLAYDKWNSRGLKHITSNQAGNILIEFKDDAFYLSVSNKTFADRYCKSRGCTLLRNSQFNSYWRILECSVNII